MLHSTVNVLHYITQYKAKMLVKIKFLQILAHGAAILDDGLRMTEVAPSFWVRVQDSEGILNVTEWHLRMSKFIDQDRTEINQIKTGFSGISWWSDGNQQKTTASSRCTVETQNTFSGVWFVHCGLMYKNSCLHRRGSFVWSKSKIHSEVARTIFSFRQLNTNDNMIIW